MRLLVLLAVGALASLIIAFPAAATQNEFAGTWQAIDLPGDGSLYTVTVTGSGPSVQVTLHDHYATSCVRAGATGGNAIIQGTGTITGDTLTVAWESQRCENGISFPIDGGETLYYDLATDTLTAPDVTGNFVRMGKPLESPRTP